MLLLLGLLSEKTPCVSQRALVSADAANGCDADSSACHRLNLCRNHQLS